MKPMLEEFKRVVHDERPDELLPMRDIQCAILILFLERVYLTSHTTEWIQKSVLREKVEELIHKRHIREHGSVHNTGSFDTKEGW